jgi:hypothetical protein
MSPALRPPLNRAPDRAPQGVQHCREVSDFVHQLFRYAIAEFGLEANPAADPDIVAVPPPAPLRCGFETDPKEAALPERSPGIACTSIDRLYAAVATTALRST